MDSNPFHTSIQERSELRKQTFAQDHDPANRRNHFDEAQFSMRNSSRNEKLNSHRTFTEADDFSKMSDETKNMVAHLHEEVPKLSNPDPSIRHEGLKFCANLVGKDEFPPIQSLLETGALRPIIENLKVDTYPNNQKFALIILTNVVMRSKENSLLVAKENGVVEVIKCLFSPVDDVIEEALWCISNLLHDIPATDKVMLDLDIFDAFTWLLSGEIRDQSIRNAERTNRWVQRMMEMGFSQQQLEHEQPPQAPNYVIPAGSAPILSTCAACLNEKVGKAFASHAREKLVANALEAVFSKSQIAQIPEWFCQIVLSRTRIFLVSQDADTLSSALHVLKTISASQEKSKLLLMYNFIPLLSPWLFIVCKNETHARILSLTLNVLSIICKTNVLLTQQLLSSAPVSSIVGIAQSTSYNVCCNVFQLLRSVLVSLPSQYPAVLQSNAHRMAMTRLFHQSLRPEEACSIALFLAVFCSCGDEGVGDLVKLQLCTAIMELLRKLYEKVECVDAILTLCEALLDAVDKGGEMMADGVEVTKDEYQKRQLERERAARIRMRQQEALGTSMRFGNGIMPYGSVKSWKDIMEEEKERVKSREAQMKKQRQVLKSRFELRLKLRKEVKTQFVEKGIVGFFVEMLDVKNKLLKKRVDKFLATHFKDYLSRDAEELEGMHRERVMTEQNEGKRRKKGKKGKRGMNEEEEAGAAAAGGGEKNMDEEGEDGEDGDGDDDEEDDNESEEESENSDTAPNPSIFTIIDPQSASSLFAPSSSAQQGMNSESDMSSSADNASASTQPSAAQPFSPFGASSSSSSSSSLSSSSASSLMSQTGKQPVSATNPYFPTQSYYQSISANPFETSSSSSSLPLPQPNQNTPLSSTSSSLASSSSSSSSSSAALPNPLASPPLPVVSTPSPSSSPSSASVSASNLTESNPFATGALSATAPSSSSASSSSSSQPAQLFPFPSTNSSSSSSLTSSPFGLAPSSFPSDSSAPSSHSIFSSQLAQNRQQQQQQPSPLNVSNASSSSSSLANPATSAGMTRQPNVFASQASSFPFPQQAPNFSFAQQQQQQQQQNPSG
ncbi:uncharacterized protein MONOS_11004 [Monocercomonoides exilis]|uniref:uncharacterized protein n=1 Tax=Monocercomonoides exilis TaxID=2049356 RepID=UPI00355AA740|nr:hypothetical protein MONOS_11004 [Monocercomonoides exilis]|eukprot:MONOS_11004.1-p1 / transcript=MONOS_11004.1 / gene=MONOS_11004 / organism=Monocercomonoides_exilis_PA203 / gene_product=unspecified product / transcript_product=unspecified product / location=Mono_scaffold00527:27256-30886(+) / protein_length=1067 / sequence_SO=supercontig / SO=protein_coding / is_pseudo=false